MSDFQKGGLLGLAAMLTVCLAVEAKQVNPDSPLAAEMQVSMDRIGKQMKSGKYEKAKSAINSMVQSCTDVPKCLAIAEYTEPYAYPMMETRRECLNKALQLCSTQEDFILVALKSRKYQFFEITKQAITALIQSAKTVPQLYDLARKAQEVAMNDVAHQAMEKAFSGLKTQDEAFAFADQCKATGLDDMLRKTVKQMVDDEDDVLGLCELVLQTEKYGMRDQTRYALRKALDYCYTKGGVAEMEQIKEVARRVNEPDVQARAEYFVKKGKLIQKIKGDQSAYQTKLRQFRESQDLDAARARDAAAAGAKESQATEAAGFGTSNPKTPGVAPTGPVRASDGL